MVNATLSPIDGLGGDSFIVLTMRSAAGDNSAGINNDGVVLLNCVEAGSVPIETAEDDKSKKDCAYELTHPVIKITVNKRTVNNLFIPVVPLVMMLSDILLNTAQYKDWKLVIVCQSPITRI